MNPIRITFRHAAVVACLAMSVALCGCAGFPDKPAFVVLVTEAPLAGVDYQGGGSWPAAQWWKKYQDETLDQLIERGLQDSPTLASAHARFDSARQSVRIAGAQTGAHVDLNGDASRQRLSDNGLFPPDLLGFHWYNQTDLGLQAGYTFDWWGKQRAAVQSAVDQAHAAQADRSAAALLLSSSIADAYFGWQADEARLALLHTHETVIRQEAAITGARVRAELDPADAMNSYDAALASLREQIAGLDGSARMRIVTLAALVGRAPAELPAFTARPLPGVSGALPDNVRLDLVARRADVTASKWRVQAAEKSLLGVRAQFYPDISISALAGLQSKDIGNLFEYGSRVPALTAAIHLPIFDAGRLKGEYGGARAAVDSAVASYRDTLTTAAREVASQVTMLAQIDAQRVHRATAIEAAEATQAAAAARVRQGIVDPRAELNATESVLQQRDGLLQLLASAVSADIGLQRALGGGYEPAAHASPDTLSSLTKTP